jgi:hypothetical protein
MELEDKISFALSTLKPMAIYTLPFLCQVLGTNDRNSGVLVGSGVRCMIRGRRSIVSAAHVFSRGRENYAELAVSTGHGQRPQLINNERTEVVDDGRDLVIYDLPTEYPIEGDDHYWPEDRIDRSLDRLRSDYLFVHGFPGVRSQIMPIPGDSRVMSRSFPYGVMQRLDVQDELKPFQFAMDFESENAHAESGEPEAGLFEEPYGPRGLSGSAVWRIGASGRRAAEWTSSWCELVGIVTAWQPERHLLIATKATELLALIQSRSG